MGTCYLLPYLEIRRKSLVFFVNKQKRFAFKQKRFVLFNCEEDQGGCGRKRNKLPKAKLNLFQSDFSKQNKAKPKTFFALFSFSLFLPIF